MKTGKVYSKALRREVSFELEGPYAFVEGVRYTQEELLLMKNWEHQDTMKEHVMRLCRRHGYVEV